MIEIAGRKIGPGHPPYVIAEASCNHGKDIDRAIGLIHAAKWAGADAIKFQAYEANTITINHDSDDFIVKDGPWKGHYMYSLYTSTQTPFDWFPALFDAAKKVGITLFASVFDESSVDLLEGLRCPAYKIASPEIRDRHLIHYALRTGKPLIVSTGMASSYEIAAASQLLRTYAWERMAFLHCVSGYPTNVTEADLGRIEEIKRLTLCHVGLSDHSVSPIVPIAATAMGACILEKHFRVSWYPSTEDAPFSLSEWEFARMVVDVRKTWEAMQPGSGKAEESSRQMRRSLYVVKDTKKGDLFTRDNVRSIRPSYGLPPCDLDTVLRSHAAISLERGTALKLEHLAND